MKMPHRAPRTRSTNCGFMSDTIVAAAVLVWMRRGAERSPLNGWTRGVSVLGAAAIQAEAIARFTGREDSTRGEGLAKAAR
jgi:hypothetical protein